MGGWESPELCSIIAQIGDGEEDTNDEDIERNIEIFSSCYFYPTHRKDFLSQISYLDLVV